jgi:hypothetical protein
MRGVGASNAILPILIIPMVRKEICVANLKTIVR